MSEIDALLSNCTGILAEFDADPGLRDIYVLDIGEAGWAKFLSWLAVSGYMTNYSWNGEQRDIPRSFDDAQARKGNALLKISVDDCHLHCHFFDRNDLELDLDSRSIRSELEFRSLCRFMMELANLLCHEVLSTGEEARENVLLRVMSQ